MAEQEFDRLLKQALLDAAEQDAARLDQAEVPPPSRRQRARMRRLLADPEGYYRRYTRGSAAPEGAETVDFGALRRRRRGLRRAVALVAVAALLGTSALANSLTGGAFLRRFFTGAADAESSAYMDAEQLLDMGGGNVGQVVETETLRLELLDAVSDGNNGMLAVRVLAKGVDSVEPRDGVNYDFASIGGTLLEGEEAASTGWQYLYQSDDSGLAANECILLLSFTWRTPLDGGRYTLELRDYGSEGPDGVFAPAAPGTWTLPVDLSGGNVHSRTLEPDTDYLLDGETYTLRTVTVTPLSLSLSFTAAEAAEPDALVGAMAAEGGTVLTLRDGRTVDSRRFTTLFSSAGDSEGWEIDVELQFALPLPADLLQSLQAGAWTIPLDTEPPAEG